MANSWFKFKQFTIQQDKCAMKVTTDACLFGGFAASQLPKEKKLHILDIGTGTGLLSLMIAQQNPMAEIDSIEIDTDAAAQATENTLHTPLGSKVNIIHADVANFPFNKKYDIIISNPPFYENELKSDDKQKNLAHHNEGLLLPDLLKIIRYNLKQNGSFYLLLPYKRNNEITKLLRDHSLSINKLVLVRQSVNHGYFRIIFTGSLENEAFIETSLDEIIIKDESDKYTSAFVDLLKDYYLYL